MLSTKFKGIFSWTMCISLWFLHLHTIQGNMHAVQKNIFLNCVFSHILGNSLKKSHNIYPPHESDYKRKHNDFLLDLQLVGIPNYIHTQPDSCVPWTWIDLSLWLKIKIHTFPEKEKKKRKTHTSHCRRWVSVAWHEQPRRIHCSSMGTTLNSKNKIYEILEQPLCF